VLRVGGGAPVMPQGCSLVLRIPWLGMLSVVLGPGVESRGGPSSTRWQALLTSLLAPASLRQAWVPTQLLS
jgi:hypothetical protein